MIRKISVDPVRWLTECGRCGRPHHRAYRRQEWAIAAARRAGWYVDSKTVLCTGCTDRVAL